MGGVANTRTWGGSRHAIQRPWINIAASGRSSVLNHLSSPVISLPRRRSLAAIFEESTFHRRGDGKTHDGLSAAAKFAYLRGPSWPIYGQEIK